MSRESPRATNKRGSGVGATWAEMDSEAHGNSNSASTTEGATGTRQAEQCVSVGGTLAQEMKDLQRSFGSPSVEVLRHLMECL
jgi:hypothetical protein